MKQKFDPTLYYGDYIDTVDDYYNPNIMKAAKKVIHEQIVEAIPKEYRDRVIITTNEFGFDRVRLSWRYTPLPLILPTKLPTKSLRRNLDA